MSTAKEIFQQQANASLALMEKETAPTLPIYDNPTPGQLMQLALLKDSAIDVIERVAALMEKERDYQARLTFDEALNRCQKKIGRIAPTGKRESGITWATYLDVDRVVRPIYTEEGFSIAFTQEPAEQGRVRVVARLSRGAVTKEFMRELPGDPANPKMSRVDAEAAVDSRAKRYLMLSIFNIAVGIDADEKKPFGGGPAGTMDERTVSDLTASIEGAGDHDELQTRYFEARDKATKANDLKAIETFANAKNKRLFQLNKQTGVRR